MAPTTSPLRVPFYPLRRLYDSHRDDLDAAMRRVLDRGYYILGPEGERFETEMAVYLGAPGAVRGCNSGTDALLLALKAMGVAAGDEVICPSLTAIPTVTAIQSLSAVPVFVDVDADTWLMDPHAAAAARTSRTKAIVAVHLYGAMVDVRELDATLLVEDVAQAMGARLDGRAAGTFGRFGAYSFYPTKNIGALGDGGAVFCPTPESAERVRMLRNYGQKDRYFAELGNGMNSRLDELQAAVLQVRLQKLEAWNERKAAVMLRYRQELKDLPMRWQKPVDGCAPGWHLAVVALESTQQRDQLMRHLEAAGVQTLIHYPHPNHQQPASRQSVSLPVTESLCARILSLPFSAVLTDDELAIVIDEVQAFFQSLH